VQLPGLTPQKARGQAGRGKGAHGFTECFQYEVKRYSLLACRYERHKTVPKGAGNGMKPFGTLRGGGAVKSAA